MIIDIVIKKALNRTGLILVSLLVLVNITFSQSKECQMYSVDFDVLSKDYPQFSSALDSYYASEYPWDLISLKIEGGNPVKSYFSRYYLNVDWYSYSRTGCNSGESVKIAPCSALLNELFKLKMIGDYMEVCQYSSSNDTYIYMIKKDGELYAKYQSSYPAFSESEGVDGFKGFIELFVQLKNLNR